MAVKKFNQWVIESSQTRLAEAASPAFVKDFLNDFGFLISLNFSQITKMGKDDDAKAELTAMMQRIRGPLINGMNYFEITKDINAIPNNPKLLSAILLQVKNLIEYIEPRVKLFVKDGEIKTASGELVNYKQKWLDRIDKLKSDYITIIN